MKQRIRDTLADHAYDLRRLNYNNIRVRNMIQDAEAVLDASRPRTWAKAAVRELPGGRYFIRPDEVASTETEVRRLTRRGQGRDKSVRYIAQVVIIELNTTWERRRDT